MERPPTSSSLVGGDASEVAVWYRTDPDSEPVTAVKLCRRVTLAYPKEEALPSSHEPVATCSYNYRYAANAGDGALKYQPVDHAKILQPQQCDLLRRNRGGGGSLRFTFTMKLPPECTNFDRKIMVVPSIGCPAGLAELAAGRHLLWAARAKQRPTFLCVHASEADYYVQQLRDVLKDCGVGIVAWECDKEVLGFGASRLAAQQFATLWGGPRTEVVMCDVNVVVPHTKSTKSGYGTDDEDQVYRPKCRQGRLLYGCGHGTGVPLHDWKDGALKDLDATKGGDGRPLEQLVVVDRSLSYDPCFVMSSEDANLTGAFLHEENRHRGRKVVPNSFRAGLQVEKVRLGDPMCHQYGELLAAFLDTLRAEDDVRVIYEQHGRPETLRVGELALRIAHGNHLTRVARGTPPKQITHEGYAPVPPHWQRDLPIEVCQRIEADARRIRSLIIEQILLKHLEEERAVLTVGRTTAQDVRGPQPSPSKRGSKPLKRQVSPARRPKKASLAAATSSSSSSDERKKPRSGGSRSKRDRSPLRTQARAEARTPPRRLRSNSSPERGRKRDRSGEEGRSNDG